MTDSAVPLPSEEGPGAVRTFYATVSAVLTKELRWRMRGRRAFVIVTVYVLLLGLLVFGVYQLLYDRAVDEARWQLGMDAEETAVTLDFVSGAVSARIGQAVFGGMLVVLTVLTLMLAPALASGGISMEREKQTLELLVTTPVSTLGMLVGKLIASLAYVILLIVASIPLMSLVFAFGGVAPEDVLRVYLLLLVVAFGIGSIGLFMSALIGRTQIATVLSYLIVLALTLGSLVLHTYLLATSVAEDARGLPANERPRAPEALLWLNPFVADVDIVCTALPDVGGGGCSYIAMVTDRPDRPIEPPRDAFWPRSALAFLVLGGSLTLVATQLISPSRRLRTRRHTPVVEALDEPGDSAPDAVP
jgi:ABC-type transport system involved in multi-copper enzyme maturation permease subunit